MSFYMFQRPIIPKKFFGIQVWGKRDSGCKPVASGQITIGVELEAYLYGLNPQYTELEQLKTYESVASALQPLAKKLKTRASVVGVGEEQGPEVYAIFQVGEDISIDPSAGSDDLSRSGMLGIEIATPILRNTSWKWVIPEMTRVLKTSFKLGFNYSTGLHVHIGIGRSYKLQDLRRISKAIVLFEKQMDAYHHVSRRESRGPGSVPTFWILSCRDYSLPLKGLSDIDMMKKIDIAANHEDEGIGISQLLRTINSTPGQELSKLYDGHFSHPFRGYRYNLTSIVDIGTVEFRQAIATDDGELIVDWISRVIKFVTSSIATPDEIFHNWAQYGISDPNVYRQFGAPPPEGLETRKFSRNG